MQRMKLNVKYIGDVFPFESKIFIITDLDNVFDTIKKQLTEDFKKFMKNGSGWTILNLERFDISVFEYKPFSGSTHIKFQDIKVKLKGKEMDLEKGYNK